MNVDSAKIELINWISDLDDRQAINKILNFKKTFKPSNKRKNSFGSGENLIEYIADDFNEPVDFFKDYKK